MYSEFTDEACYHLVSFFGNNQKGVLNELSQLQLDLHLCATSEGCWCFTVTNVGTSYNVFHLSKHALSRFSSPQTAYPE